MAAGKATHLSPRLKPRRRIAGYIELHAHSDHSLLDGVPSPEALVARTGVRMTSIPSERKTVSKARTVPVRWGNLLVMVGTGRTFQPSD
jgi:hypothetical protein